MNMVSCNYRWNVHLILAHEAGRKNDPAKKNETKIKVLIYFTTIGKIISKSCTFSK